MNNLSKNQIIEFSKTELTQNQINSFKYGNTPNKETKMHSAILKALEIATIYYYQEGKEVIREKLIERIARFDSVELLEKDNETFFCGI